MFDSDAVVLCGFGCGFVVFVTALVALPLASIAAIIVVTVRLLN